jgi:hypothetical protein
MLDKAKFATKKNSNIYQKDLSIDELKKLSTFLSKIFKKNLSFQLKNKFSAEFLNWLYNENPNGKAIVNNVYEDEKIIAHFALIPISVMYKNEIYKSALSVFTAVDENNRGLYFFHKLASKSFDLAKSNGLRFIIGVSNQISSELFVKCFNFKLISPLEVKIGLSKFNEKNDLPHIFEVFKDKKTICWRLNNPRFKYQICKQKKQKEFIIFNNHYKLFKMHMGFFSTKDLNFQNEIYLKTTYNLNPFNMWIGLNNNLEDKLMSFNFPEIFKPSPLNLIIKDLNSKETNLSKKDIKFNLIDFEIF